MIVIINYTTLEAGTTAALVDENSFQIKMFATNALALMHMNYISLDNITQYSEGWLVGWLDFAETVILAFS